MADKTAEEVKKELEAMVAKLKKEKEEMAKRLDDAYAENEDVKVEVEELREAMDKKKFIGPEIKGSFSASYKDQATGKRKSKVVKFARGHKFLFIDGNRFLTEAILAIANGDEATEKQLKTNPTLVDITQERAAAHLTHLAMIGYACLV